MGTTDWVAWHASAYGPEGPLRRRLEVVRRSVADALTRSGSGPVPIVSICAGDGRDVIGGLAGHRRAADARVLLLETDPRLAEAAREAATAAGLTHVVVLEADAGVTSSYRTIVPAGILIVSGLFSHITDADVRQTIETLPVLCARNAFVIWTRDRTEPDLTPSIREWFAAAGFQDLSYSRFTEGNAGVGMERLRIPPPAFVPDLPMFRFQA